MNTLSQVPEKIQHILTTTAYAAVLETGFVSRHRKLTGDQFVQTLVFSWLDDPDATYTTLQFTRKYGIYYILLDNYNLEWYN